MEVVYISSKQGSNRNITKRSDMWSELTVKKKVSNMFKVKKNNTRTRSYFAHFCSVSIVNLEGVNDSLIVMLSKFYGKAYFFKK